MRDCLSSAKRTTWAAWTVGIATALAWTERVVHPLVDEANVDLQQNQLVVNYDAGRTDHGASVTLTVSKFEYPG